MRATIGTTNLPLGKSVFNARSELLLEEGAANDKRKPESEKPDIPGGKFEKVTNVQMFSCCRQIATVVEYWDLSYQGNGKFRRSFRKV